jgi:hypothetical protein
MRSDLLRRAGMERYVGLDVSQEQTSICVVDGSGMDLLQKSGGFLMRQRELHDAAETVHQGV